MCSRAPRKRPNFLELRHGEVQHSPAPIGQGRRRGDAHIVGYYAPDQRVKPSEGLGHRGGVLRDLIQDPACGLPRIPLPRTPVNKLQIRFSSQVASASSDGTARTTAPICPSMSSRSISTQASTILPSATLFRDRPLKVTCLPVGATPMNSPSWVP